MDNDFKKKGRTSNVELFPRWMAQTTLSNPEMDISTSAYMIAGDSKLERKIQIARGFPNDILKKGEIVTTSDVMNLLNAEVGDKLVAEYDMFQLLSSDFIKMKRLIFEFDQMNIT